MGFLLCTGSNLKMLEQTKENTRTHDYRSASKFLHTVPERKYLKGIKAHQKTRLSFVLHWHMPKIQNSVLKVLNILPMFYNIFVFYSFPLGFILS